MFKLALSAGHYLGTRGKRCHKDLDPNETREWWLNNRVADKLEKILAEFDGIEILRVDDTTGKKNVTLRERADAANEWGADFYLAIHHNASRKVFNGGGIVAYACNLASPKSYEWQSALYAAAIKHTGLKGNRANPLARANLFEVREPKMPAVLMECGFMDSTADVPIILTEEFADDLAKALAEVIVERSGAVKKASNGAVVTLPILARNARGGSVRALQSLLNMHGATLSVDGSFGPATEKAVKDFQTKNSLSVDGKCGPVTWGALLT